MEITYLKSIQKGYIAGVQTIEKKVVIAPPKDKDNGVEVIDKDAYDKLLEIFKTTPQAIDGFEYKLKKDLTWELCLSPIVEENIEDLIQEL